MEAYRSPDGSLKSPGLRVLPHPAPSPAYLRGAVPRARRSGGSERKSRADRYREVVQRPEGLRLHPALLRRPGRLRPHQRCGAGGPPGAQGRAEGLIRDRHRPAQRQGFSRPASHRIGSRSIIRASGHTCETESRSAIRHTTDVLGAGAGRRAGTLSGRARPRPPDAAFAVAVDAPPARQLCRGARALLNAPACSSGTECSRSQSSHMSSGPRSARRPRRREPLSPGSSAA
jgi:hypothetical protein